MVLHTNSIIKLELKNQKLIEFLRFCLEARDAYFHKTSLNITTTKIKAFYLFLKIYALWEERSILRFRTYLSRPSEKISVKINLYFNIFLPQRNWVRVVKPTFHEIWRAMLIILIKKWMNVWKTDYFTMVTLLWLPQQYLQGIGTSKIMNRMFGIWHC